MKLLKNLSKPNLHDFMFNKLFLYFSERIGIKIISSFSVICLLVIGSGIYTLSAIRTMNGADGLLYNHAMGVAYMNNIRAEFDELQVLIYQYETQVINDEQISNSAYPDLAVDIHFSQLQNDFKLYKKLIAQNEDEKLLTNLSNSINDYKEYVTDSLADAVTKNDYNKIQELIHETSQLYINKVNGALNEEINYNNSMASKSKAENDNIAASTMVNAIILFVIAIVLAIVLAINIIWTIVKPINNLINESNTLAKAAYYGQLEIHGDPEKYRGGFRKIIIGMNCMMEAVSEPLTESSQVLQRLAQGDLTVKMSGEYKGSYNLIKKGLNQAIQSFNELLYKILVAADEVATGSSQISAGSQSLSQGVTEQAESIEQLAMSISGITLRTKQNAANALQANSLAIEVKAQAVQGTGKMNQVINSIMEISEATKSISKINKVINDIAFQTTILALNATVEAAHAGQYGKGFAVVAEEVRNLASKSAEAAKETTLLIENSILRVEKGTKVANDMSVTFEKISESVQRMTNLAESISKASNEQAEALVQIDHSLTLVSNVVQTNSATAEESAASSKELSGQAGNLKILVEEFKLA